MLELGEERYPLGELVSFVLAPITKPVEPTPLYGEGTFRIRYLDGQKQQLLGVAAIVKVLPDGTEEPVVELEAVPA